MGNKRYMDSLERVRISKVLPLVRGKLLDLGCGYNNLVALYSGFGVGVDIYPWSGVNVLIGNAAFLPFRDECFDSVTIIAALNHIPNRLEALREVHRILKQDGHLFITMIGPLIGFLAHIVFRQDDVVRGMHPGERKGLSEKEIAMLLSQSQFRLVDKITFQLGLNHVYIAIKS